VGKTTLSITRMKVSQLSFTHRAASQSMLGFAICLIYLQYIFKLASNSRMYQKSYRVWIYILTNELN
jgi:hypothetical protein